MYSYLPSTIHTQRVSQAQISSSGIHSLSGMSTVPVCALWYFADSLQRIRRPYLAYLMLVTFTALATTCVFHTAVLCLNCQKTSTKPARFPPPTENLFIALATNLTGIHDRLYHILGPRPRHMRHKNQKRLSGKIGHPDCIQPTRPRPLAKTMPPPPPSSSASLPAETPNISSACSSRHCRHRTTGHPTSLLSATPEFSQISTRALLWNRNAHG